MAVLKDFFSVVMVLVIYGFATTFAIYITIQLGLWILMFIPIMLVGLIVIIVRKKSADTQKIGNLAGNANTTRTKTIRNFNLNLPVSSMLLTPRIPSDLNRRSVFEGPNPSTQFFNETQHNLIISSYAHVRTRNEISTISRPTFDNFSLQRQTFLQRPSWDFESRVAESNRLPISLSEPSNSVGANVPSAPPLEGPLSLPSYDEVINQSNYEIEEEPPPTYDEVILKINSNLWPKIKILSK